MLHITICDDEKAQLQFLQTTVSAWAYQNNIELQAKTVQSAEQFLFVWEEEKTADILLLDIEMPGMNGMELAKKLRQGGEVLPIIFITGIPDYILEGYDVDAISYLLKPFKTNQLFHCLDKAYQRLGLKEPALLVEGNGEVQRTPFSAICYLESEAHDTLIHCGGAHPAILRCKTGIHQLEQDISKQSNLFYKVHRSYLINLLHIQKITKKDVYMDNQDVIPIARGKWELLNQAYLAYYRENEE